MANKKETDQLSEPNLDLNHIIISIQILYGKNNSRDISAGIINLNERLLYVTEFQDNEHFSNFESLIIQTNPENDFTNYTLLLSFPSLATETSKLKDIIVRLNLNFIEKNKNDFSEKGFENDLQMLLSVPLVHCLEENKRINGLMALHAACNHYKLYQDNSNHQKFKLKVYTLNQYMRLDLAAQNALSILGQNDNDPGSLLYLFSKCNTMIGSRLLRRWLKQPLSDLKEIQERLNLVELLIDLEPLRKSIINDFLKKIPDLDKLYAKFYKVNSKKRNNCSLIDSIKVYQLIISLKTAINIIESKIKNDHKNAKIFLNLFFTEFQECLTDFEKLEELIEKSVDLNKAKEGIYMINPNYDENLQKIDEEITRIKKKIEITRQKAADDLENTVNLVDSGSYTFLFEIKKKEGDLAFRKSKKEYRQVSIKNRIISFTNDSLMELASEYSEKFNAYNKHQETMVQKLLSVMSSYYPVMEQASYLISKLDVLCSFSHVAANSSVPFVKPTIKNEGDLILRESRHPCLEVAQKDTDTIANNCEIIPNEAKMHIITGPNMGGKSTYIRQVAISCFLAHLGSFVPCSYAEIPLIDAIIARVGASDMQLRGISTFMSEMLEASCMNSLVIIDELGRGTSTSEGFGLAWAIAEFLVQNIGAYCLFATHFHEMTKMEHSITGVKNYYVEAIVNNGKLTMMYKVKRGAVDRSYGLFVAEMLNFPKKILDDAKRKANELENYENSLSFQDAINESSNFMEIEINKENLGELKTLGKMATPTQKELVIKKFDEFQSIITKCDNPNEKDKLKQQIKAEIKSILKNNS